MDFIAAFILFLVFFAGFGLAFVYQRQVKRAALGLTRAQAGEIARKRYQEQESDLMAMLSEAAAAFKQAKESGEDMKDAAARILPALALKYPSVSLKFGKRLLSLIGQGGNLSDLEHLLSG